MLRKTIPRQWCIAALVCASIGCSQASRTPPAPAQPTTGEAHLICQQFVSQRLKAPSTAKFPGLSEVKAFKEADHMTVIGYVDSQNGFGAQIRTHYTCSVQPVGEGKWRLMSLDV